MSTRPHTTVDRIDDPLAHIPLAGITIRDRDLTGLRIVNSMLDGARISGYFERLAVNDVDVTEFVSAELDRRHPERAIVREARTADELRAAWTTVEDAWNRTVADLRRLPAEVLVARAEGEWNVVETLRHLVFATDCWVRCAMFDLPDAFHPLGLSHTEMGDELAEQIGLRLDADVSFDEVLAMRADRMDGVRRLLADVTDEQLDTIGVRSPAPDAPEERHSWRTSFRVVMNEEVEHRRYLLRDLAVITAAT